MNENLEKTLTFKWAHWCSIAGFWRFSNVRSFQLYGTDYKQNSGCIKYHKTESVIKRQNVGQNNLVVAESRSNRPLGPTKKNMTPDKLTKRVLSSKLFQTSFSFQAFSLSLISERTKAPYFIIYWKFSCCIFETLAFDTFSSFILRL